MGVYVIVEPAARNTLQLIAGVATIAADHTLVGVGLIVWALGDAAIKAAAGAMLLSRKP